MNAVAKTLSVVPDSVQVESIQTGFADDLFGMVIPSHLRSNASYPVRHELPPAALKHVPEIDPAYQFRKEHCRVLQIWYWADQGSTNIMIPGETGAGKTSLLEQSAARLNWPLFKVGCHGALEFQELIGRVTLNPDGSTGWADGPLILAMKYGGIFLLDEINFMSAGAAGGLNTALDGALNSCLSGRDLLQSMERFMSEAGKRGGFFVPETGEVVHCHPCFRLAATGNAINGANKGKYRGVQTPNMALLDRFTLGINMTYMSEEEEAVMLQKRFPVLDATLVKTLCESAKGIRTSYAAGQIGSVLSTRIINAMAARISKKGSSLDNQLKGVGDSLEMSLLYRLDPVDASAIRAALLSQLKLNFAAKLPAGFTL